MLVARAEEQRSELATVVERWRGPLAVVDQGLQAVRYIERHPLLLLGAAAFVVVLSPKRALVWLQRGWLAWRMALEMKRRLSD
jgi:hypothetical protein